MALPTGSSDRNSVVTTAESLRQQRESDDINSIRQLELVLSQDVLAELTPEITHFLSVREISMSLADGHQDPDWTCPEAFHFFEALGELPKVKSIKGTSKYSSKYT